MTAPPGAPLEAVEDINELRFIEHGKRLQMIPVQAKSLSMDTPKDLEYVRPCCEKSCERGRYKWACKSWTAPCGTGAM